VVLFVLVEDSDFVEVVVLVLEDDAVDDLELVGVEDMVLVLCLVFVISVDFEMELDELEVLEGRMLVVAELEADGVLDATGDFDKEGLAEVVLEDVTEDVDVRVKLVDRVDVVEEVVVLEDVNESVTYDVEDPDFDLEVVPVVVMLAVIVFVDVELNVFLRVGTDERVDVVVFVDVLDCVGDCDGTRPITSKFLKLL